MIPLGQWGESWLDRVLNGAGIKQQKPLKTSLTYRKHDQVVKKIAHESKGGLNVKLNGKMMEQILKDAALIKKGKIHGAHWHFFQAAQPEVLSFLEQNGIAYTVY